MSEAKTNPRSKIDSLFANSPANVRVKATDSVGYAGQVSPAVLSDFLKASQKDAFVALALANAKTLKRSIRGFDPNGNAVSVTQSAVTE